MVESCVLCSLLVSNCLSISSLISIAQTSLSVATTRSFIKSFSSVASVDWCACCTFFEVHLVVGVAHVDKIRLSLRGRAPLGVELALGSQPKWQLLLLYLVKGLNREWKSCIFAGLQRCLQLLLVELRILDMGLSTQGLFFVGVVVQSVVVEELLVEPERLLVLLGLISAIIWPSLHLGVCEN